MIRIVLLQYTSTLWEYDATSSFDRLRIGHMLDQPGPRGASGFARHSDRFVFHRDSGGEDSEFAGFPGVRISGLGRRQRNVDYNDSLEWKPGMDDRVFPGPALALVSGDGVAAVARGGAAMDCALGPAGLGPPD